MSAKKHYVIIEPAAGSPRLRGCDSFITPWESFPSLMEDYGELMTPGEPVTLTITVREFTQEEYDAYCEENGVET